jgi:uncharacterized protein (DUF2252 family)
MMAQGKALREGSLPVLFRRFDMVDAHIRQRIEEMTARYHVAEKVDGEWHFLESPRVKPDHSRR